MSISYSSSDKYVKTDRLSVAIEIRTPFLSLIRTFHLLVVSSVGVKGLVDSLISRLIS